MAEFFGKLRQHCRRGLGRLSTRLPTKPEEFVAFASSTLKLYGLPDERAYHHSIATMIMHLGPTVDRAPKHYFAVSVRKSMANEVAFAALKRLNEDEKKARAAEAAAVAQKTSIDEQSLPL